MSEADRAALENLWGEAGAWVADTWTAHNAAYFDGQVRYHAIVFGFTPHGGVYGHTNPDTGRITLYPSLLDPESNGSLKDPRFGTRFASDTLLHEMIHAYHVDQGEPMREQPRSWESPHNNEAWCREIARITPLLGLAPILAEPVRPRRINGKVSRREREGYLSRDDMVHWPHSLRPEDYFKPDDRRITVLM